MSGDFDNLWNIQGVWSVLYIVGGAFSLAVLILLVWCLIQVIRPMFYCCKVSYCSCCLCGPCASDTEDSFERDMKIELYTGIFEEALAMHESARHSSYEEEDEVREKRKRRSSHSESDTVVGRPALHPTMSRHESEHLLSIIEEDDIDDDNVFFGNSEDSEDESDESDNDSWGGRSERHSGHRRSSLNRLDHAASAAMKAVRKKFTSKKPLGQRRDGQIRAGAHGGRHGRQMRHAHGARAARMRTGTRAHKAGRMNRTSKPAARQRNRLAANKKGSAGRSKKRSSGSSKSSGRSRKR